MKLTPDAYSVKQLIDLVDRGSLALPQFQRTFVWHPGQVVELLVTVSRGWPAGTFLLLDGPYEFAARPIEHGPSLTAPELLILDGQQRMTALYQAFQNVGPEVYFVDFDLLAAEDESDDFIRYGRRPSFDRSYGNYRALADERIAPVGIVSDDAKFFEWLEFLPARSRRKMIRLRDELLPGLKHYDIPAVRLPREMPIQALAKIFETLNRTGVRLATFDLMVARLYPFEFHLAEKWAAARLDFPDTLGVYRVDGVDVLKLICLGEFLDQIEGAKSERTVRGVRESDVLALPADVVIRDWEQSVEALAQAIEFVKTEFGVLQPSLLPPDAMLLPIATAFARKRIGELESRLRSWYWRSVLAQTYAQGANTQVIADARRLFIDDTGDEPASWSPNFEALADTRRRNEILLRAVLSMSVIFGARDWLDGEYLWSSDERLVMHQVFPRRFLRSFGIEADSILNFVVLKESSSRALRDLPPSGAISALNLHRGALTSHGCDRSSLIADDWPRFVEARYGFVVDRLQELLTKPTRRAIPTHQKTKHEVRTGLDRLWERLGEPNRQFLTTSAEAFGDGEEFTLQDLADLTGESLPSIRARIRNLGRSIKSLGDEAPKLFEQEWNEEEGRMFYVMDPETRQELLARSRRAT